MEEPPPFLFDSLFLTRYQESWCDARWLWAGVRNLEWEVAEDGGQAVRLAPFSA